MSLVRICGKKSVGRVCREGALASLHQAFLTSPACVGYLSGECLPPQDGARSPHMHKYPYRERPYPGHHQYRGWDQGRAGMVPRSHHCYRKMSNSQLREMEMARSEMPHPDKKEKKDLEKKTSGGVKRVREGDEEKEKASAEETAGEEGTQR